nr:PREDICTED: cell cycle control protein 50A [Bemisia tabaci]
MDQPSTSARVPDTPGRSKRPFANKFKQQRLPAWQPILTASSVLPTFFAIGVVFIPIGVGLLHLSQSVQEKVIDYTYCTDIVSGKKCSDIVTNSSGATCQCKVPFTLDDLFRTNVYIYYGLSNYYQNHRRYVKSRDDFQLLGKLSSEPSSDCEPYAYTKDGKKPIAPCGAIANSLFNDELSLFSKTLNASVPLLRTGIAWPSDKEYKFKNPPGDLKTAFSQFAKPKDWKKNVWELDPVIPENNGLQNEDFIVWMRTAALPTFRKLYRRVDHSAKDFNGGLPQGDYELIVKYSYQVTSFKGTKSLIISNTSMLGGKNPFLGIAYITVGCICIFLGVVFLFIHIKFGKKSADVINISPSTSY